MKSGISTTEFWITAIIVISVTILLLTKTVSEDFAKWVISLSAGGYSISRGLSKYNGGK